jgi:hypothetical protein
MEVMTLKVTILFIAVALTIPKWQTFELGATFELIGGFG